MHNPCATNPDLWFGYSDDDGSDKDGTAKARAYELASIKARAICLRRCPLAQQRLCAQLAVEQQEEYGVWAGVKLPGGQYRKRDQLASAHEMLRAIAAGELNPRELPESVSLLEHHEADATPTPAPVFHLPAQVGPRTAA
ncbi:MAG TPA: WhiB family transcriptional regulator [Mycobacterium sp.]|nr:WhiB family transcriptional regulator [Mycobacterium sp.]